MTPDAESCTVQLTELEEVKALVLEALEKVTDKGAAYAHLARHVMQREAGWEKWKAGGANDFDRPPMQRPVGRQLPPVGSPNGQEEPPRKRPRTAVTKYGPLLTSGIQSLCFEGIVSVLAPYVCHPTAFASSDCLYRSTGSTCKIR